MIRLIDKPKIREGSVENIKILEFYHCYGDIAMFWQQDNSNLQIGMLDGNMVIDGECENLIELKEFVNMINPKSIFAKCELLDILGLTLNRCDAFVMKKYSDTIFDIESDTLSSKEVYYILNSGGLDMPPYEHFAVDFCRRLNLGRLKYFGIKDKACVVSVGKNEILLNGIKSIERGMGSFCLNGLLSKCNNKNVYAVCKEDVKPFYIKNGFREIYKVGYYL